MSNSWNVMLWKSDNNFNNVMRMCIDDNSFGISYDINSNLNNTTDDELDLTWDSMGKTNRQKKFYKRTLNIVKNVMKIGDIVFLCKGSNIYGVAIITSNYIFDLRENNRFWLPHRRKIKIITLFKTPAKSSKQLRQTIHKIKF